MTQSSSDTWRPETKVRGGLESCHWDVEIIKVWSFAWAGLQYSKSAAGLAWTLHLHMDKLGPQYNGHRDRDKGARSAWGLSLPWDVDIDNVWSFAWARDRGWPGLFTYIWTKSEERKKKLCERQFHFASQGQRVPMRVGKLIWFDLITNVLKLD